MMHVRPGLASASLLALLIWLSVAAIGPSAAPEDQVLSIDRFVSHISTVPINAGQSVGLHVRERVLASVAEQMARGTSAPIVLFVHGGFSPAVVAYDMDYKDYSWMAYLARAGFDVFAMTQTGYGASPKPGMDDPCNVAADQQPLLIPHVLKEPCAPRYPYMLVSSQTEWDEVGSVVNHILALRGAKKLSMIGWSTGTPRVGGFAATHPELVDRLVLFAPAPFFPTDQPPSPFPAPGAPMILQTRERLENDRWLANVKCPSQIDDKTVHDEMWKQLMAWEGLGATWMPGGVMRAPNRMNYGWRLNVPKIKAPTLVLLGEFDDFQRRLDAWKALTVDNKVFIKIACGSHFLQYEHNRKVLHDASKQWLQGGSVNGLKQGLFSADADGRLEQLRSLGSGARMRPYSPRDVTEPSADAPLLAKEQRE